MLFMSVACDVSQLLIVLLNDEAPLNIPLMSVIFDVSHILISLLKFWANTNKFFRLLISGDIEVGTDITVYGNS